MDKFYIDRIAIVGVGLIGGSVASRLKRQHSVGEIIGVGRGQQNLEHALDAGLIDVAVTDVRDALDANMILIAVPVRQVESVLNKIRTGRNEKILITDVGSTKGDFAKLAREIIPDRLGYVVPGHPIAGSEKTGSRAADPELFDDKNVILCPLEETYDEAVSAVKGLWDSCGARVVTMPEAAHDKIFSAVSHLPHVVSYCLVEMMNRRSDASELFDFAAGGFRDFSRIAGSSSEMWTDICRANRTHILEDLEAFIGNLKNIQGLLRSEDFEAIERIFNDASTARNNWASKQ